MCCSFFFFFFFFFNDTATTEIYTLSLHDALPIWGVGEVGPGRGRFEDDARRLVPRQQPVDALGRRLDTHRTGPGQPVGGGVDADHVTHVEVVAAPQLDQQVGTDVAGADDRGDCSAHHASPENRAVTLPRPANRAVTASPAATGIAAVTDPGSTTYPASSTTPCTPTVFASQTRDVSGEPSTAPPAPVATSSPLRCTTQPPSRRSTSDSAVGVLPSTTPPEEALSAMVSAMVIAQ